MMMMMMMMNSQNLVLVIASVNISRVMSHFRLPARLLMPMQYYHLSIVFSKLRRHGLLRYNIATANTHGDIEMCILFIYLFIYLLCEILNRQVNPQKITHFERRFISYRPRDRQTDKQTV